MSGGTGSRLWPLSRQSYPKQLLPLFSEKSLLQETALRVTEPELFGPLITIANAEHRFAISEQLRAIGLTPAKTILEPVGRNTAPAAAVAALVASEDDPDAIVLLLPVDHLICDVTSFRRAIATGLPAAKQGKLVLFGIRPNAPATGYGYVEAGKPLAGAPGVMQAARFVEKPDIATATRYCASAAYLWNSGIFLLPARVFLSELERHAPEVLAAARAALAGAAHDLDFTRLAADAFEASPPISIDYAVIEKTDRAAVVPGDFDWNDVGSWSALRDASPKDEQGNVCVGDVIVEDVRGCYLRSEGPLVAALGVEDLVIIATPDVVLAAHASKDQDIKALVERLRASGHQSATQTQRVHRPWGFYQSLHSGDRFQVKRITVNPGAQLSLQKLFHRAEHWVVVNGTALVTRNDDKILLRENESIFVPLGATHRLENPGKLPLNLIEVQSGAYLGEDDILRLEDIYHRDEPGSK
jgi:mannose-1-phosphate guanylyltransferase/mannose-1-phosphate guanylyltransferase/mannose-6-phosphate isomerase